MFKQIHNIIIELYTDEPEGTQTMDMILNAHRKVEFPYRGTTDVSTLAYEQIPVCYGTFVNLRLSERHLFELL